jgi:hypothetical protein
MDPTRADELVQFALAHAERPWFRLGRQVYVTHERGVTGVMLDLMDGTYLAFGYLAPRPRARTSLTPLGRVARAQDATALAERFVARQATGRAPDPTPSAPRRWWLRAQGFNVPAREAITAVVGTRAALKAIARRYRDLADLTIDLEHFQVSGASSADAEGEPDG